MSGQPINIGLVGCGDLALRVHLPNLLRNPDTRVTALADPHPERLAACARLVADAERYTDYNELLARPEVDAVVVSLPNALHARAALDAMDTGKHLYLEKPLGMTLEEGREVLRRWQAGRLVGMIGFSYRFNELYEQLQRDVGAGRIGRVVGVRSLYSSAQHDMPEWKRSRGTGGGVLHDLVSHEVDLLRFVLGTEVEEVHAWLRSESCDADTAVVQLRFPDGVVAQVFASLLAVEEAGMTVYGERGSLSLRRYESSRVRRVGIRARGLAGHLIDELGELRGIGYLARKLRAPMNQPAFEAAMRAFVAAVRGERAATPDLADGFKSLAIVAAADESARTGLAVRPAAAIPDANAPAAGPAGTRNR